MARHAVLLDLSNHCIETAARMEHSRLLDELLTEQVDEQDPGRGQALALLKDFLDSQDFAALRSGDPDLAGGRQCKVKLHRDTAGRVKWEKFDPSSSEG